MSAHNHPGHQHCFHNAAALGGIPRMAVCCKIPCGEIRVGGVFESAEKTHGFAWQRAHLDAVQGVFSSVLDNLLATKISKTPRGTSGEFREWLEGL